MRYFIRYIEGDHPPNALYRSDGLGLKLFTERLLMWYLSRYSSIEELSKDYLVTEISESEAEEFLTKIYLQKL